MGGAVSGEANGRIKLSWAQVAWAIATIAAVLGSWYDTRAQIGLVRAELGIRVHQGEQEHARMWKAIDDANAAARTPPPTTRGK